MKKAQKLRNFLKENQITQAALAEVLGKTEGHISRIVNGDLQPSLSDAYQIEVFTGGAVSMAYWVRSGSEASPQTTVDHARAVG